MRSDAAEALKDRLRADIKAAMQARAADEVRVLRTLLAAIDNAQAVPVAPGQSALPTRFGDGASEVPRLVLTESALSAVLLAEIAERQRAAEAIARCGRPDEAERLRAEAALVQRYTASAP